MKVAIISFADAQLDGAEAGKNLSAVKSDEEEEEKDFYAAAADCPIHPKMGALTLARWQSFIT